ncbi:MAG: hypothetical protein JO102_05970, partial [Elusimicrobia bacterium]|nr:hypothetical protein [Elusimicrobiota bacterium]
MKRVIRAIGLLVFILAAVAAGLLASVLAALWLMPGTLWHEAAAFASRGGVNVRLDTAAGTPSSGWSFDRLAVSAPGLRLAADTLSLKIDWASTVSGRPSLDWIRAAGLRVWVSPAAAPANAAPPPPKKSGTPFIPVIRDLQLARARFELHPAGGQPFVVDPIDLRAAVSGRDIAVDELRVGVRENLIEACGHYEPSSRRGKVEAAVIGCANVPGLPSDAARCIRDLRVAAALNGDGVRLERLTAIVAASTVTANGVFHLSPFSGRATIESKGPLAVNAALNAENQIWTVEASAVEGESAFHAHASARIQGTPEWNAVLTLAHVPAAVAPGLPPAVGELNGRIEARGRGQGTAMTAAAQFALATTHGPAVSGAGALEGGVARADIRLSSGGVSGRVNGRWALAQKRGVVDASISTNGRELAAWSGVAADGKFTAHAAGTWPKLRWNAQADVSSTTVATTRLASLGVKASGRSLSPPDGRLEFHLSGLQQGKYGLDSAAGAVQGRPASHHFDLKAASGRQALAIAGRGHLNGSDWSADVRTFELTLGPVWRNTQPFRVAAGPSGAAVRGFRLKSSSGAMALDGALTNGTLRGVAVNLAGIPLDAVAEAARLEMPLGGLATLRASANGPLVRPDARAHVEIQSLAVDKHGLGDLSADLHYQGTRLV